MRIKLDFENSPRQWMFVDLSSLATVQDLQRSIEAKFELRKVQLILDDAILPKNEPIAIVNNGDVIFVKVDEKKRKTEAKTAKKKRKDSSSSATDHDDVKVPKKKVPSSDSSSSDSEANNGFEQPFKQKSLKIQLLQTKKEEPEAPKDDEEQLVSSEKKRKRKRKNKNKNKLDVNDTPAEIVAPLKMPLKSPLKPSGKVKKFSSDEEMEVDKSKVEPSSAQVTCEEIMLGQAEKKKATNGLENLLKLADKPKIVKKMASRDVYSNQSVVLTNGSNSSHHNFGDLEQYPKFEGSQPLVGQLFAFKSLQIGPDYTPQITQFIGELKHFSNGDDAILLILFDENEGKSRSEKFEVDDFMNGVTLRNREIEFKWSMLNDIRLIK